MKKIALLVVACAALAAGADAQGPAEKARGQNKKVQISEVPAKFLEVAKAALPGAEWTHAEINYDLGTHPSLVVYEIAGRKGSQEVEVDVRADGSVEEVEETIDLKDVPKPVLDLLNSECPGFQVKKAEKSTRPYRNGTKVIWYEFKGTTKDGALLDVEITEDGKYFVFEAD